MTRKKLGIQKMAVLNYLERKRESNINEYIRGLLGRTRRKKMEIKRRN